MPTIRSLRPNVTRDAALAHFRGSGPLRWLRAARAGPVRSLADVYVPFRLFRVRVDTGTGSGAQLLALDLVRGTFDLYAFQAVPGAAELVSVVTRNCAPARLDPRDAEQLMRERMRREVFRRGFFRLRRLTIEPEPLGVDFHVPYWLAFSGRGDDVHLQVMDAVRRRTEGAKVREFMMEWLCESPASTAEGYADAPDASG
jgi:hypothetical protein